MSLILDALKKSEAERQRGQAPNILSPLPAAPSRIQAGKASKLPWLILMAALFAMIAAAYFCTISGCRNARHHPSACREQTCPNGSDCIGRNFHSRRRSTETGRD